MADARNYKQYRREVLDRLGVQYYDEDIEEFDRWRLKVLQGLKDLYGEENIINAINAWLDEHTVVFDGATASEEGEAGLVPPTTLGTYKRQARAHYHLNAEGDWVVDPVWEAYGSGYEGTEKIKIKYPNSTGTASVNIEAIGTGQKGVANGVATLGADGKVPSEQMQIPLADNSTIGGIKIETAGDPPRPSVRLTTNWTPSYPNVSDVTVPLIRNDGTISAFYIPEATQSVKGAMSASDKTKLDSLNEMKTEVLKTLTTDNDPLYNHNRTVTVYYDGDVLPTVKLYNEEQTSYGYARRWVYEANEVMVYTTNDHPEYGEHKAKFWFINRASSNLTQLTNGSKMICEYNANYAEGGNIEH